MKGKAPAGQLAESFVRSLGVLSRFLAKHPPPFIAKFYRSTERPDLPGRIELWLTSR